MSKPEFIKRNGPPQVGDFATDDSINDDVLLVSKLKDDFWIAENYGKYIIVREKNLNYIGYYK